MKHRPGRPTKGLEHVDAVEGSPEAKRRLKVILEVTAGEVPVKDGASRLGLSVTRLEGLRIQALQGAVSSLESRPGGRPRKERSIDGAEVAELKKELAMRSWELEAARVREEIALVWPHLVAREPSPPVRGKARASRASRPTPDARIDTGGRSPD